jgi:hypothetical protein
MNPFCVGQCSSKFDNIFHLLTCKNIDWCLDVKYEDEFGSSPGSVKAFGGLRDFEKLNFSWARLLRHRLIFHYFLFFIFKIAKVFFYPNKSRLPDHQYQNLFQVPYFLLATIHEHYKNNTCSMKN